MESHETTLAPPAAGEPVRPSRCWAIIQLFHICPEKQQAGFYFCDKHRKWRYWIGRLVALLLIVPTLAYCIDGAKKDAVVIAVTSSAEWDEWKDGVKYLEGTLDGQWGSLEGSVRMSRPVVGEVTTGLNTRGVRETRSRDVALLPQAKLLSGMLRLVLARAVEGRPILKSAGCKTKPYQVWVQGMWVKDILQRLSTVIDAKWGVELALNAAIEESVLLFPQYKRARSEMFLGVIKRERVRRAQLSSEWEPDVGTGTLEELAMDYGK